MDPLYLLILKFVGPIFLLVLSLWFTTARKEGSKDPGGIKTPWGEISALYVPKNLVPVVRATGVSLLVLAFIWGYTVLSYVLEEPAAADKFLGVGLASVTFETGDWNPRVIDLRTSELEGIHAEPGVSLRFIDLQVSVPETITGTYYIRAGVYANGETYLGKTETALMVPGSVMDLNNVVPENFEHPTISQAWMVKDEWENLVIRLDVLQDKEDGSQPLASVDTTVKLADTTYSWYLYPPYANFAAVVYSVNNGPALVMDLRNATREGINVKPGDTLVFKEIWVKSLSDSEAQLMYVESYPSAGDYDGTLLKKSEKMDFKAGITNLVTDGRFEWQIPQDKTSIVITLSREDNAVLDRLAVPFKPESTSGLLPADDVVLWPQQVVEYLDFEEPASLDVWEKGWGDGVIASYEVSDQMAFSGSHSVAVTVVDDYQQAYMMYNQPFRANYIVGQVFWPAQDGILLDWAQVCLGTTGKCTPIPLKMGQWNTFIFDLSQPAEDGTPQNQMEIPDFYIQGHVIGVNSAHPYTFYVDGIQIYPVLDE